MTLEPELNRSWLKRGWGSPTPTWGLSVPDLWAESQVTFVRRDPVVNEYGSFVGNPEIVIWETVAHCEIVEERAQELSTDFVHGPLLKRKWSIFANYPADTAQIPREGDVVRFTTVDGTNVDLQLKHVYVKDSLSDHIQADTIEFE